MSNDPKHPTFGDMAIDASDVQTTALTPEQIFHFSKLRPGFEAALQSLLLLAAAQAQCLGISDADLQEAGDLKTDIDRLHELLPVAEEIVRRLRATLLDRSHRTAMILHSVASTARRRADRDPEAAGVLGTLVDLLHYVSEPGQKAAATRKKNKKGKPVVTAVAGEAAAAAEGEVGKEGGVH